MADMKATDRARLFASSTRVFTVAELTAEHGEEAGRAIQSLVAGGELVRHAQGVLSIAGIASDDARVIAKIDEIGARELSGASVRSRRTIEDRIAEDMAKRAERGTAETMPEKIRRHFAEHPVALTSELRRLYGNGASAGADALVKTGELRRVEKGLYTREGIDPLGKEMQAYAERHAAELAEVKREIDQAIALEGAMDASSGEIEYNVWRKEGRAIQVYVAVPGMPVIYGQTIGKGDSKRLGWYGKGKVGDAGRIGSNAAEHVARMVFNPMPSDIRELINLVESNEAPRQARRRSGSYRTDSASETIVQPWSDRYVAGDGVRLDPTRLSDPLPEPVMLEMDDREDDRLLSRLTDVQNLNIIRRQLPVGDFRAIYRGRTLIFERKTSADLAASIDDGRLKSQVRAMSDLGHPCCFLIEGGMFAARPQPIARLAAMQSRLVFGMNMPLIETLDIEHTAYEIVVAIRDHFFGTGSKFDISPRRLKAVGPLEVARVMLETIPGLSTARAAALLRHFGSLSALGRASVKEIAEVEGIGKGTAEKLHETLHAQG